MMSHRIVHQATALTLAAVFTFSILGAIDMLAVQPAEHGVLAAKQAGAQVVQSAPQASANQRAGG